MLNLTRDLVTEMAIEHASNNDTIAPKLNIWASEAVALSWNLPLALL